MRICIVYHGQYPPEERIEKIAKSLSLAGHKVFVLCNNLGGFKLHEEEYPYLAALRIGPTFKKRRWNALLKFPIDFNPLWLGRLMSVVRRFRIDVLHVVDIPLSVATLGVGRLRGLPVVLDMWENYPEALRLWGQKSWKTRLFKNYRVARAVEGFVIRRANHIITVVEEQKERLIGEGVPAGNITVVTNAVDPDLFASTPVKNDTIMDREPGGYKLLYAGAVTAERGLDDIIRALPIAAKTIPAIRFYIAGGGNDEARLRSIAAAEGAEPYVRFLGWVPFQDIHSYVHKSDLCLVPHVYSEFINTTIPNKIFQYMISSKPVLVSNAKPLARIVRESECGFVFTSGNPADAAEKIVAAYQAPAEKLGESGRRHAQEKYTWEKVAPDLLRVYEGLNQRTKGASGLRMSAENR